MAKAALEPNGGGVGPRFVHLLGVRVMDDTMAGAIATLGPLLTGPRPSSVYFVNAHTLNLASEDPTYRAVLNSADFVFGDGIGVRLAARARGVALRDNLNGTDMVPALFSAFAGRGLRYFLLGAAPASIERAAARAGEVFAGWTQAGCHHGYLDAATTPRVLEQIARAKPHLLLVGMGNPLQEQWLADHREQLHVPLSMAVGGLFDYWAGNLERAPAWARRHGLEWAVILSQQPRKFQRYVVGNPLFVARLLSWRRHDLDLGT